VQILALTALHLVFLPWALGTVHAWSQIVSLVLSAGGLALALRPQPPGGSLPPLAPVGVLRRWPFFWAGLALLGYVAVQALNPSWRFVSGPDSWTLVRIPYISWLPSGVDAPFLRFNAWRSFIIILSLWLLVCSVRTGLRRRLSYNILFSVLAANGALLALLGLAEQLTQANQIFWSYRPSNLAFAASFIYRNHAGAYLDLAVAASAGLAWWHYRRFVRKIEGPAMTVAFSFSAALIGLFVIISASRMATLLMFAFVGASAGAFIIRYLGKGDGARRRMDMVVLAAAGISVAGIGFVALRSEAVWARFADLANDPSARMGDRTLAREATREMFADRGAFGWGAGCFRYGFPLYAQHFPEIYQYPSGLRKYWEHAHDDLLEIPAELGWVGLIPLGVILLTGTGALWRVRFWTNPLSYCLVAACVLTLVHGWVDFVFQCPAVLLTWSVLLAGAARWAELDTPPDRAKLNPQRASIPEQGASRRA
jgi:hypothetical protein